MTGRAEDADPATAGRPVRVDVTQRRRSSRTALFADPPTSASVAVTEIAWDDADALAFPLCIIVVEGAPGLVVARRGGTSCSPTTAAGSGRGSRRRAGVDARARAAGGCDPCEDEPPSRCRCGSGPRSQRPGDPGAARTDDGVAQGPATRRPRRTRCARFTDRARLSRNGVTFRAGPAVVRGGDGAWSVSDGASSRCCGSTRAISRCSRGRRPPAGRLRTTRARPGRPWSWKGRCSARPSRGRRSRTCSRATGDAPEFVVEVESNGEATLRFGDGVHGRRPETDTSFEATYRVGNGVAGNVGRGAIAHVATSRAGCSAPTTRSRQRAARTQKPPTRSDVTRPRPTSFSSGR